MNPLYSMTGFASLQTEYNHNEITCEVRALNSRYLEIIVRLPRAIADQENAIKDIIRKKITRGKISFNLSFSSINGELQHLMIDPEAVKLYKNLLEQIRAAAGIEQEITLDHLLFFKDIITYQEESPVDEELLQTVYRITEQVMEDLNQMRANEGENLRRDLLERLARIETLTREVAELGEKNPRQEFERLYKRLLALLNEEKIDPNRLELELALISDKVDITEETIRMQSHIQLFRENLRAGSPIGKKLNFLLQEMHREANTMSNKATMIEISHRVVNIKEEVEKMREQIQNVE